MIKSFLKDSFYYTIPSLLSKGLSIFLIPLYTKILNPTDYGVLDLFLAYFSFINLTITIDIVSGLARFYIDEKDEINKKKYFNTTLYFSVACYTIFILINFLFLKQITNFVIGPHFNNSFFVIGLFYLWFNGINYVLMNQLRFDLRSKENAKANILNLFLTVASTILFVIIFDFKLNGIVIGYLIGSIGTFIYLINLNKKNYLFTFSHVYLKEMLTFSFPLLFSGISVWVNLFADRIILNHYVTLDKIGIFGIGSRISSIAVILIIGVQTALGPLIYKNFDNPETRNKIAKIFRYFVFLSLVGYMFLCFNSKEILEKFTTKEYASANSVIFFLVPAAILSQSYAVFAPGPWIFKNSKFIMWTNIIGSTLNISLNFVLVPKFGIVGAAIGTLSSHLGVFLINMYYSQNLYKIPYNWFSINTSLLFSIASILITNYFEANLNFLISSSIILFFIYFTIKINLIQLAELKSIKNFILQKVWK